MGGRRFARRNDFRNKLFTARPTAFLLAYFVQLWKLLATLATWKLYRRAECSGASALVALHVASSIASVSPRVRRDQFLVIEVGRRIELPRTGAFIFFASSCVFRKSVLFVSFCLSVREQFFCARSSTLGPRHLSSF